MVWEEDTYTDITLCLLTFIPINILLVCFTLINSQNLNLEDSSLMLSSKSDFLKSGRRRGRGRGEG